MYKKNLIETKYLPPAYAATMGNCTIIARFDTLKEREDFFRDALAIVE